VSNYELKMHTVKEYSQYTTLSIIFKGEQDNPDLL